MKRSTKHSLFLSLLYFVAFVLWTCILRHVDVQPVGPQSSRVGLATLNLAFHRLTGVHMSLYTLTDWLGLVPLAVCLGFALLGLCQWIKRKKLSLVDPSILILGGFYLVVMAAYLCFEEVVINHRPVLIQGRLEASYPSSTTLLTACVMITAIKQLPTVIKPAALRRCAVLIILLFTAFMIVGRLISGVHWLTDIAGAMLLSGALVSAYDALCLTRK